MTLGFLDLSLVTDALVDQITSAIGATTVWTDGGTTPFTIDPTGLAPDAVRSEDGCHLSIYLAHVAADKYYRNTYPTGGPAQRIPIQPLPLTLYYLVTAHAGTMVQEQQAMSIALKWFHENPIVRFDAPHKRPIEITMTLEPQSLDDMSRLWQAMGAALRMSALYRASVVFLQPPDPPATRAVLHPVTFDPPKWDIEPFPDGQVITPAGTFSVVDGLATIVVPGAGFAAGTTTVQVRSLPLTPTTTPPTAALRFRVIDAKTIEVRLPNDTPKGEYLTTVRVSPTGPVLELTLVV